MCISNISSSSSVTEKLLFNRYQILVTTATITLPNSPGCDFNKASPVSQLPPPPDNIQNVNALHVHELMEAQSPPGAAAAAADPGPGPSPQPARAQALPQPLYLKALTIPLLQPIQPGCFQPHGPLLSARSCVHLDGSSIPLILNPLVPAEGAEQPQPLFQKQLGQSLTLSIVSTLPVLSSPSSCVNASIGSPGKSKKSGKYICKHCGRDCLKPSVLEKHIRSHTGERPFPCTTCGIAFKTQSNLYKHRRTQTHVNNTRLPSDSDIGGGPEQNERSAESTTSPQGSKVLSSTSEDRGIHIKPASSETSAATDTKKPHELSLPATSSSSAASENQETTNQSLSSKAIQGHPEREPQSLSSPGALPNGPCLRKKMQEQRTPTANKHIQLQRQQATSSEKQWDYKALDCKLKKCESTDSGYLSRSDSTEQQMTSSSPLHSLYEHSTELENETAFSSSRCASGSTAKPEAADKATASMLEKKRLEEHISKLISHNKSVVDDTQLDNVRPRKTVLSKQGSIDLPMPYTYKDSFHFDIRTCDVNRKKNLSLCSAKSTFAPLEKCKPMFFHSVPTQFSTTVDTVPVTRSNSLPVVEGARLVHDKPACSKPLSLTKQSVNTGTADLLPSNDLAANSVDFPNSHPRALVRQAAVDDLPLSNVTDHPSLSEELKGTKKLGTGEVISAKNKKHNQRKLKMFSQEKWQMYGDETFKKIYQKMKSSQNAKKIKQRENKITDSTSLAPNSRESASSTELTEERNSRSSASDSPSSLVAATSTSGKSGTSADGNHVLQNVSSEETAERVSNLMETSQSIVAGAVTSQTSRELSGSDREKCTAGSSTLLAPSSGELRLQNPECQLSSHGRNDDCLPVQSSNREKPSPGKESSAFELDCKSTSHNYGNHHGTKESGQHDLTPLWVQCNNRETAEKSQTLPSERKKLKFEVEKTQNLSSAVPGGSSKNISEQKKKTVVCKKEKLSTNKLKRSHKQKRIKVTPKWYRGRHIHGFAQLKMNRLSKRPCCPNRALDALRKGCSSQPPRFHKHKKCHPPQSKMQAVTSLQEFSRDVAICCWVSQPLVLQPSLPAESRPRLRSHPMAASFGSCPEFTNTGTGDQPDSTNPEAAAPLSLHPGASQENILRVESESQIFGISEPVIQASGREKAPSEENTHSPPTENSAPSSQPGCSRLFGAQAESVPETVTRAQLPSREDSQRANLSQHLLELHRSADKNRSHLQPNPYGRPHGTALSTFKKPPRSLRSPEFKSYSATPTKTYKKRGLEMMRKQTRVEYDDTSSDDEDRLLWVLVATNGANIEKGNDTKVSDLTSLVAQEQESFLWLYFGTLAHDVTQVLLPEPRQLEPPAGTINNYSSDLSPEPAGEGTPSHTFPRERTPSLLRHIRSFKVGIYQHLFSGSYESKKEMHHICIDQAFLLACCEAVRTGISAKKSRIAAETLANLLTTGFITRGNQW
ncbi:hypothetical protein IHE44_0004684 [Lamprotornis superbus]|uniref:C2H2-type domain-containing protein n=1 Tax=Lamprotornis superbus TaxID=245042 RepID=A0A835NX48_9PASS|nr:hypothetical protein IHE44_0004684 [Lamprotornis superbus]